MNEQTTIWQYKPHQAGNVGAFLACFALVPIPWAIWSYLKTRSTEYRIEEDKLYLRRGIWSIKEQEVHLVRVKKLHIRRSLSSLLGVNTIVIETENDLLPTVRLEGVKDTTETENLILRHINGLKENEAVPRIDDS